MHLTLLEILLQPHESQAKKHNLGQFFPEEHVNQMSNMEFLAELSEALERYMQQINLTKEIKNG